MSKALNASFLPQDYLRRKVESRSLIINLVLFAGMITAVGGAFIVTNRQWAQVRATEAAVNAEYEAEAAKIDQLKTLDKQKQELMYRAEVTSALVERVLRSILISELVNRMPPSATLTDVVMESVRAADAPVKTVEIQPQSLTGKPADAAAKEPPKPKPPRLDFKLAITGLAGTDTDVADFQAALQNCPLLDRVDLISTQAHLDGELALRKFRIEAVIKQGADTATIQPIVKARTQGAMTLTNKPAGRSDQSNAPDQPATAGADADQPNP
jgi:Tfp pilus assembly protein PilN